VAVNALILGISIFALFFIYAMVKKVRAWRYPVHNLFGVNIKRYQLIGSDVGGSTNQVTLRNKLVIGSPDALFKCKSAKKYIIGEFKSRRYRNHVKKRERYQVILYTGVAREQYRTNDIEGVIRYKDRTVSVPFCEDTYRWLLGLVPEYIRVESSFK